MPLYSLFSLQKSKIDRFENLCLKIDRFSQTSRTCANDATDPGLLLERVPRVQLHPSVNGNRCTAPVLKSKSDFSKPLSIIIFVRFFPKTMKFLQCLHTNRSFKRICTNIWKKYCQKLPIGQEKWGYWFKFSPPLSTTLIAAPVLWIP